MAGWKAGVHVKRTHEQRAVVDHPLGPLRVAAGAGTGKTTTMADRLIRFIVSSDVASALGITFTVKASDELRVKIDAGLREVGADLDTVDVMTYHGLAHQLLIEFGAYVGIERDVRLVTPGYVRQMLRDALGGGTYTALNVTSVSTRVEDLAKLSAQLTDNLVDPEEPAAVGIGETAARRSELLQAIARYRRLKADVGVLDYGDLVALAYRLVSTHGDIVIPAIRGRYQVVLLDEYQDTNPAQRLLFQALFGHGFPLTAVGDADQTIYEWRGASLENFDRFPEHFPNRDGSPSATLALTTNWRSDQAILDIANQVSQRIGRRPTDLTLQPRPNAGAGTVGHGWFRTSRDEADWIAETIAGAHEDGTDFQKMAVLFRKNAQIPVVRDALAAAGIPVQVVSLGGLLSVPEVTDLWAWLRILDDPSDGPALMRVLLGAHFQLGFGDLAHLSQWLGSQVVQDEPGPGWTLLEAIYDGPPPDRAVAASALERFRGLYTSLLEAAQGHTLVDLCRRILSALGVWIEIEALEAHAARSARLNLYRFLDLAESWSPLEGRPSLKAFLEYLTLLVDDRAADELDEANTALADAVTLITAHRAKGLEWDIVFLPALVRGTFPSSSRGRDDPISRVPVLPYEARLDAEYLPQLDVGDKKVRDAALKQREDDQEWRTAYVAVTRARRALYATGAFWYTGSTSRKPSDLFDIVRDYAGSDLLAECAEPGNPPIPALDTPGIEAPDPHFPEGWKAALRAAVADPNSVRPGEALAGSYDDAVDQLSLTLEGLTEQEPPDAAAPPATSVSALVTYATCPKRYYWSEVDRLPRRPARWLRAGIELHRQIELHNRGVMPLELAGQDTYDFVPDEAEPRPDAFASFQSSRFASARPRYVEVPFVLDLDEARIRGRIDAVYADGSAWEVVDFKNGRRRLDPARQVQLQAYAVAVDAGSLGGRPASLTVTFAYFGDGLEEERTTVDADWLDKARVRLGEILSGISNEVFEPDPSEACRHCDFAKFCEAGQQWLAVSG